MGVDMETEAEDIKNTDQHISNKLEHELVRKGKHMPKDPKN